MSINDKIKQVLLTKNLSPSYLADDIGVQRSSISHILSGRNRPSLDIIQKIVRRFPEFTYDWFMEDDDTQLLTEQTSASTPSIPHPNQNRSAFQKSPTPSANNESTGTRSTVLNRPIVPKQKVFQETLHQPPVPSSAPLIDRILIFYTDGTFREYTPA